MLLLGVVTLVLFPVPTFIYLGWKENISVQTIFQFENATLLKIGLGLEFGFVYGILALLLLKSSVFDKIPTKIEDIVRSMNLNFGDALFLSFCAGFGEELLFRSGIQYYLGVPITSIIFVAIHGYLNPWNWRYSLYGLIVLPFILILSYGFVTFGLWFAIAAHFAYDTVLFTSMIKQK
jgi:membrane protease YdiL (CAAX protease family)